MWKQGRVTLKEYKDTVQIWRDRVKKIKLYLELNLDRNMKCIKIFRGTLEQKEDKEKCSKGTDDEGHSAFFRLNFIGKISFLEHHVWNQWESLEKGKFTLSGDEQGWGTSQETGHIRPLDLTECRRNADCWERWAMSWQGHYLWMVLETERVLKEWKIKNDRPIFKKEHPEKHRSVHLTLILGQVI